MEQSRTEIALQLFYQLVLATESSSESKMWPADKDMDKVAATAFRYADAFIRTKKNPESFAPNLRPKG